MRLVALAILAACSRSEFEPPPGPDTTTDPPAVDTVDTAETIVRTMPWDCFGRAEVDTSGDGRIDYVLYEIYDPDRPDLLLREEQDVWDDGQVEWAEDFVYDDQGRAIREAEDSDGDGDYDEVIDRVYDAAGNLVEEAFDADGDGAHDEIWSWTFDAAGLLVLEEVDLDGDGALDEIREWMYDAKGLEQTRLEDLDADGTVDLTYTYVYGANDRLQRIEGDAYLAEYTWPGPFDSYTRRVDEDGDGIWDEILEVDVDERGLLTRQDYDIDGDGHFETGWHDVAYDAEQRFSGGLLYIDVDPSLANPDIWTYDYTFANPTGPWYLVRHVDHQSAWGGPIDSTWLATYAWTCP